MDIASDSGGNRLYVADQGSHDINAYFINRSNGNLTQVPGSPIAIAGVGHSIKVHPSGHFVYASSNVSGQGTSDVNAFAVQSDGSLKPVAGSPFPIPGSTFLPELAMDPQGQYLYASTSSKGGAVAAFSIDEINGALTPVPGSPFNVPVGACNPSKDFCQETPTDLAISPNGKFLYGALDIESAIAGFAIDRSTGALSDLAGSPYQEQSSNFCPFDAFGACPDSWKESIDPNGKFLYVADDQFNDISIFTLNQTTGIPTFTTTSGNTKGGICVPLTLDVDPSGSFIYSLGITVNNCGGGKNAVVGFALNQASGQANPVIPGLPLANPDVHTTNDSEEKVLVTQ